MLGYQTEIKWFRQREEYFWKGIKVSLDFTKGYGYILELEKMSDENNQKENLQKLKKGLEILGIEETARKEFDEKFAYYKKNWKKLIR